MIRQKLPSSGIDSGCPGPPAIRASMRAGGGYRWAASSKTLEAVMASPAQSGSRRTGALTAGMVSYRSYSAFGARRILGPDTLLPTVQESLFTS